MKKSFISLWGWFEKQGLYEEEFQYFMKDIFNYMDQKGNVPLDLLNQELETLGWGIQLMDETAYKQMLILHQNKNHIDLKGYVNSQR
ncbi:MAG: hypothetical protein JSV38_09085 [Desulfobacterales bacterium]|nr:MAG: hypothetical protein JSV38_09085 [Desulfobacterales bacterium]